MEIPYRGCLFMTPYAELPDDFVSGMKDEAQRVSLEVLKNLNLKRRRVLIVGGAGYIGSVLTERLLTWGHDVRSTDLVL
jgi:hypothetical protein